MYNDDVVPIILTMRNKIHSLRLLPGQDLKKSLELFVKKNKIKAGVILSSVGSLTMAELRLADQKNPHKMKGPFEIIQLNGTLTVHGLHLHLGIADSKGRMMGGHLLPGCFVHTTCELVILEMNGREFTRQLDPQTSYKELLVKKL